MHCRGINIKMPKGRSKKVKPKIRKSKRTKHAPPAVIPSESSSEDEEINPDEVLSRIEEEEGSTSNNVRLTKEVEFGWCVGERTIDAREEKADSYGAKLVDYGSLSISLNELDYFLHFFPMDYLRNTILPMTNRKGKSTFSPWKEITVGEFLTWLGIRFFQETLRLSSINDYWGSNSCGAFPAIDMTKFMHRSRFFAINRVLQLSDASNDEDQVLMFIEKLNATFQSALRPGHNLTVDESMIASWHHNLLGRKKIKRKPRPVGVEIKNLCDSKTMINLVLEKNESKVNMAEKEYHREFGATTACTLRLTRPYHGTGRTVYGDSWFGSVKTCQQLKNHGLFSTLIVKTAHINFPLEMLRGEGELTRGQYKSCINPTEDLIAVRYQDSKEKLLVSSCATTLPGPAKVKISSRTGLKKVIPRPKVFHDYCNNAGSIDIYNHVRTGSVGLEDTWKTHSGKIVQFAGLLGFVETNAFLAKKHFCCVESSDRNCHNTFRKNLSNQLLYNTIDSEQKVWLRPTLGSDNSKEHAQVRLSKRTNCYICSNFDEERVINQTLWYCRACGPHKPLCSANTGRQCFAYHINYGFPEKKYRKKMYQN